MNFQTAPHSPNTAALPRERIAVRDVRKTYGSGASPVVAIENISFTVREGEFVALLGPSGCGKSTVLNMVAGLIAITEGAIEIDGQPVRKDHCAKSVGYVFQRDTTYPWRTVAQNVGYGLEIAGVKPGERKELVDEALAVAGLYAFRDHFPLTLSGGMRQRVSLMRTLVTKPQILLMDEPFGALDTHTKLEMHRFLLELWDRERQTVLFVTHDLGEALTLADRVLLMSARPSHLKEDFAIPFARPRDAVTLRETKEYGEAFSHMWHSLGEEFRRDDRPEGAAR
ncbi:MAG TPA: ABC transporter ATP-binding protein [Stellaceae bacterium]|nr:ABC transporter ATP-binding protein [Stellaceae bacterium]